jgi:hypothetical protein
MMKSRTTGSAKIDLLLASGLGLYAESVLIRWMGAEIRMFAYLKNFTLLAAFLGLGLGMLRRRDSRFSWMLPSLMSLLVLTMVFSAQLRLTRLFFPDSGIAQWAGSLNSPGLVPYIRQAPVFSAIMAPFSDRAVPWVLGVMAFVAGSALFVVMVLIFSYLGERIGELLREVQPPLEAYTLNLIGSLAGTLIFVVLVLFTSPPWVWFVPILLCLLYFSDHRLRDGAILSVALIAAIVVGHSSSVLWSPYYRISLQPEYDDAYQLSVDHDFHQDALDLRPDQVRKYPVLAQPLAYYNLPYKLVSDCGRVLIIGSGTGNDIAAALRAGCRNIDAVEIDPMILKIGRKLHPEQPYQSDRVHVVNNDGRAYLHQALAAGKRYDLIVFGLVDSQTALSVVSSLRLEFLLYSEESFKEAISLLDRENGLLVVGFSVGFREWVAQRMQKTMEIASGSPPLVIRTSAYVWVLSFVTGPGMLSARQMLSGVPDASESFLNPPAGIEPVRDDWPYLYYNPKSIPLVYLASLILIMMFGWFTVRNAVGNAKTGLLAGIDWPMFFMGAAFLLVETKNISQLAILFGATWLTNMVVFASVFIVAILANLIVERKSVANLPALYAALGISLLLSYFLPFSSMTQLPMLSRAALGGSVTALPVLFSSFIFAKMFKETDLANNALGSNILGGLLGGSVESLSVFFGVRAMVLLAIAIYGASWIAYAARRREVVVLH